MAEAALKDGEIDEGQFKDFSSEVIGALQGKDANQRSSERIRAVLDEALGPPPLRAGEDDMSEVCPSTGWNDEFGELNGTECKARIVHRHRIRPGATRGRERDYRAPCAHAGRP
jgi:hypothetical protein